MRKKIFALAAIIICIIIFYLLNFPSIYFRLKEFASNPEKIRDLIQGYGALGPIVIIIIQIIQVVISPIPGMITSLAAGALYGVFWGFLLNVLGIFLGSISAFYLARTFGKPLVIKIIGKKAYNKYSSLLSKKYTVGLFIIFLLPFFPDDALCLLAGISGMDLGIFIFYVLVGRSPGMFVSTLVGAGMLTLSMPMWILLAIISMLIIIFSIKYNKKIEDYALSKVERHKRRFQAIKNRRKK